MKAVVTLSSISLVLGLAAQPAAVSAQSAAAPGGARQTPVSPYDGIYGPLTVERVKRFQRAHALEADGVAGPATLRALRLPPSPSLKPGMRGPAVARLQAALDRRGFWNLAAPAAEATPRLTDFPTPEPALDGPEPTDDSSWITPAPLYTDQPAAPSTPEPYADWEPTPAPSAPEALRPNARAEEGEPARAYVRFGGAYWLTQGASVPSVRAEAGRGPWLGRLGATFLDTPAPGLGARRTVSILDAHLGYDLGGGALLGGVRLDDLFAPSLVYGSLGIRVGGPLWGEHLGWGVLALGGLHPSSAYFVDGLAALEGRLGPLGATLGWRVIGQHWLSPGGRAPSNYYGPQAGLTLQF